MLSTQHSHRLRAAFPRSPVQLLDRAQNDFLRALSFSVLGLGAGAFRFDPVSRLYLARPLAVYPAPFETGNFSPLPTLRLADFFFLDMALPRPLFQILARQLVRRSQP